VLKDIIFFESGTNDEINNFQDCLDPTPKLYMDVIELNLVEHNKNKWCVNNGVIKHVTWNGDVLIEFKKEDGTTRIKIARGKSQVVIKWATL
jgi:hypothetical protein